MQHPFSEAEKQRIREVSGRAAIEMVVRNFRPIRALALSTVSARATAVALPSLHPITGAVIAHDAGRQLGLK